MGRCSLRSYIEEIVETGDDWKRSSEGERERLEHVFNVSSCALWHDNAHDHVRVQVDEYLIVRHADIAKGIAAGAIRATALVEELRGQLELLSFSTDVSGGSVFKEIHVVLHRNPNVLNVCSHHTLPVYDARFPGSASRNIRPWLNRRPHWFDNQFRWQVYGPGKSIVARQVLQTWKHLPLLWSKHAVHAAYPMDGQIPRAVYISNQRLRHSNV